MTGKTPARRSDSGTAAIEFAVGSVAFLAFVFAVINIGYFAFSVYALNRAVAVAARYAAIEASVLISAQGPLGSSFTVGSADCPTTLSVQQAFQNAASPPWPGVNPWPTVTVSWWGSMAVCSAGSSSSSSTQPPGGGVTVSATAPWSVLAGGLVGVNTITLNASQSASVALSPSS